MEFKIFLFFVKIYNKSKWFIVILLIWYVLINLYEFCGCIKFWGIYVNFVNWVVLGVFFFGVYGIIKVSG